MPRPQNGKIPASASASKRTERPIDYMFSGDLWLSDPSWREPGESGNQERLAIAQVQWRAVQAVLAAHGRRFGAGAWLAQKLDEKATQLQNKLKGSYWLQPHDLTLWAQVLPSLDLVTIVGDDPHLPEKWRALARQQGDFLDTGGASLLPDDWAVILARLGVWMDQRTAPAVLDAGAVRLALAECFAADGIPVARLVPHEVLAVPAVLAVRWASRLGLVGIVNLLPAEHDGARWAAAIRDVHQALIGLSTEPADEVCLLVLLGEALLYQLPWLPSPASVQVLPVRLAVASDELERLDIRAEEAVAVDLLARGSDAQTGRLLVCRLAALPRF